MCGSTTKFFPVSCEISVTTLSMSASRKFHKRDGCAEMLDVLWAIIELFACVLGVCIAQIVENAIAFKRKPRRIRGSRLSVSIISPERSIVFYPRGLYESRGSKIANQ